MARILLIDPDPSAQQTASLYLKRKKHEVIIAENGKSGLLKAKYEYPNLIVLDLLLPDITGFDFCKSIRNDRKTAKLPVIILASSNNLSDKVYGFESGADDYILKPFSSNELIARIEARLREQRRNELQIQSTRICLGNLEIWPEDNVVIQDNNPVNLTAKEFELLKIFLSLPNQNLSREYLLNRISGPGSMDSNRSIDTLILNLKSQLPKIGERIQTLPGIGYRFLPGTIKN